MNTAKLLELAKKHLETPHIVFVGDEYKESDKLYLKLSKDKKKKSTDDVSIVQRLHSIGLTIGSIKKYMGDDNPPPKKHILISYARDNILTNKTYSVTYLKSQLYTRPNIFEKLPLPKDMQLQDGEHMIDATIVVGDGISCYCIYNTVTMCIRSMFHLTPTVVLNPCFAYSVQGAFGQIRHVENTLSMLVENNIMHGKNRNISRHMTSYNKLYSQRIIGHIISNLIQIAETHMYIVQFEPNEWIVHDGATENMDITLMSGKHLKKNTKFSSFVCFEHSLQSVFKFQNTTKNDHPIVCCMKVFLDRVIQFYNHDTSLHANLYTVIYNTSQKNGDFRLYRNIEVYKEFLNRDHIIKSYFQSNNNDTENKQQEHEEREQKERERKEQEQEEQYNLNKQYDNEERLLIQRLKEQETHRQHIQQQHNDKSDQNQELLHNLLSEQKVQLKQQQTHQLQSQQLQTQHQIQLLERQQQKPKCIDHHHYQKQYELYLEYSKHYNMWQEHQKANGSADDDRRSSYSYGEDFFLNGDDDNFFDFVGTD